MAAKFVAEQGAISGQELALADGDEWIVGRDPDECQILIEDSTVSRKQLLCRTTPQGISIENLNSANPIHVNDEIVDEPQILHHGDTVRIGDVLLRFLEEPAESVVQDVETEQATVAVDDSAPEEALQASELEDEEEEHDSILSEDDLEDARIAEVAFDPTAGRRFVLKVVAGPNSGAELGLETAHNYVIGTDANSCDITLHDISVSHHHAKLSMPSEGSFMIEDLGSRNGVFIDGVRIAGSQGVNTNEVIALGTSAFVIYDKDAENMTIVSPLMPTQEKLFQKIEAPEEASKEELEHAIEEFRAEKAQKSSALGSLIILGAVTALLVIVGSGVVSLFQSTPVELARVNKSEAINEIMADYPSVSPRYNEQADRLLLLGHLLTQQDLTAMMFRLQELRIGEIIDKIYIDELIWQEQNEVLSKNPAWTGVTMHAPQPGRYVLNGFLRTRDQSETLNTYLSRNFDFINRLENRVLVEENILSEIDSRLQDNRMYAVTVDFNNGDITLGGNVSFDQAEALQDLIKDIQSIPGVKGVRNFVVEASPTEAMENLTGQYEVTGYSARGGASVNVVINGRILQRGDKLDGMTIISIRPNSVFLERDGIRYRIDYNQ